MTTATTTPSPDLGSRSCQKPAIRYARFRDLSTWRRPLSKALRWGLPALAVGLLARSIANGLGDMTTAWESFKGQGVTLAIGALLVEVAWTVSLSQVYRSSILAFGGKTSPLQALRVSMGAFTLSRILPGGGAVGALFAGREFVRQGNPGTLTLIALIVAGWVSLTSLALLVSLGIGLGCLTGHLPVSLLPVPLLTLLCLAGTGAIVAGSLKRPVWRGRVFELMEKTFRKWAPQGMSRSSFEEMLVRRGTGPGKRLSVVGLWACLSWMLDAAALWLVFSAFEQILHPSVLAVGYGAANLIQALPEVTPGWLGVLEGTLAVVYAGLGVPMSVAVLAVIGYRLVSFWIPVVAGLPWALSIVRTTRKRSMR